MHGACVNMTVVHSFDTVYGTVIGTMIDILRDAVDYDAVSLIVISVFCTFGCESYGWFGVFVSSCSRCAVFLGPAILWDLVFAFPVALRLMTICFLFHRVYDH